VLSIFKKKKLTLREIHKLYLLLKNCLPEKEEEFLIDEIDVILDKATPEQLTESFKILKKDFSKKGGLEIVTLFIEGFRENNFFDYVHFVRGLNG
jgi:hypothetical protein